MVRIKIGRPRIRFVTIRSILSETVILFPLLLTFAETTFWMYLDCAETGRLRPSLTFSSLSRSFTAYHLLFSSEMFAGTRVSISLTAFSTSFGNCICLDGTLCWLAHLIASSTTSLRPVPLRADVSTIGHPSAELKPFTLMLMLFFLRRSTMLSAITTGIPISRSCVARYRFLSMFVASTRSMITSGFSFRR